MGDAPNGNSAMGNDRATKLATLLAADEKTKGKRRRDSAPEKGPPPKHTRLATIQKGPAHADPWGPTPEELTAASAIRPNADDLGRDGLRRSVTLALVAKGFDGADPQALESMTSCAETYLQFFIEKLVAQAESCRRPYPIPTDFEIILERHTLSTLSLDPHLQPLISNKKTLNPKTYDPIPIRPSTDHFKLTSDDFLGPELSGESERQTKPWIPKSLPPFPSKHTYKFTPDPSKRDNDLEKKTEKARADLKLAERALRNIRQAENRPLFKRMQDVVQRDPLAKQREDLRTELIRSLAPPGQRHGFDMSDFTIMVDYSTKFHRQKAGKQSYG